MTVSTSRYRRRLWVNRALMSLSVIAAVAGLTALGIILTILFQKGIGGIDARVFTEMTPPPGSDGGLLNPIYGSVFMTGVAVIVAMPLGILAGTYLAEYGRDARVAVIIRLINDVLLSAPSVVVGLFIYELMVRGRHFSAWAGAMALAIIAVPVIVRTTEDMLRLIPDPLREAATALGAPRWHVISKVAYQAARAGIVTGILLAIARISGETAPLLFTALNNQFWSTDPNAPMASLPAVIFQFAGSAYKNWQDLAWAGALIITAAVLVLNIVARLFRTAEPKR
ncbi:MAG: phosphate ABC transporter permease PstA [Alphaproteobacteria bacterium]|nr:phosphate ABC transporter permease PstA [Alphaproteobacteria bacterium]